MSIYYLDYDNGNDANTGLGWWKVIYTGGTGAQPVAGETGTGGISGATAKIISVTGTWGTGGTLYLYAASGIFQAYETLTFTGGGSCTAAEDTLVASWKTITAGPTTPRIIPLDNIHMGMSPQPVSAGNATWTNNSATLALVTAQTINIETCDGVTGDWIQSANVVETKETTLYKEGSGARKLVIASAFTTGIVAYKNISTLNLSTTQKISFWIRSDITGGVAANTFRVDLCSDDAGVTPVNSFTIPHRLETARWYCLTFNPDTGAPPVNLGAAIESIALYALLDPGAATVYLDNILACTSAGLNLQSLLGKNTSDDPTWWTIKSINGTTVIFGEGQQTGTGVCTYSGFPTPETVTTYSRETIKTALATAYSTYIQSVQDFGTLGNLITFSGGWNPVTNTQDGKTFFDGLNGWGYGINVGSTAGVYTKHEKIACVRYHTGWYLYALNGCEFDIEAYSSNNVDYSTSCICLTTSCYNNLFSNIVTTCNNMGLQIAIAARNKFSNIIIKGNVSYGIILSSSSFENIIYNLSVGGNGIADILFLSGFLGGLYLESSSLLSTTEIAFSSTSRRGNYLNSLKHDQTVNNHKKWITYGESAAYYTVLLDTTIDMYDIIPSTRITPGHATLKAECPIAQVTVDSGQTVTVSVKVRESVYVADPPQTDYNGDRIRLLVKKNVAAGISADTVLATATIASEGAFETIQGTTAAVTDNGVLEFALDCSGTTGWCNFDTIVVT